ncbi:YraN family protein [Tepidimicrobium xylanilyticum]|uniref:YraN family protein n=1 Tax=Tepidimicrobium xylanilyticum TaxID=1123352 RepID=UPI00264CBE15|nr:YraN family protein [Tepidimicrobium xylanilyticum]GMG97154.1 UPF0102 protein [Tepidimicrobium xylanilyticum]
MGSNIDKGIIGETEAVNYLMSKGYKIMDRNYRTRIGEIDIVAVKSNILAFIEVKARTSLNYGYPYEAVNRQKQRRIHSASLIYIKHKNILDYQIRYDIIEVFLKGDKKINHIKNAF